MSLNTPTSRFRSACLRFGCDDDFKRVISKICWVFCVCIGWSHAWQCAGELESLTCMSRPSRPAFWVCSFINCSPSQTLITLSRYDGVRSFKKTFLWMSFRISQNCQWVSCSCQKQDWKTVTESQRTVCLQKPEKLQQLLFKISKKSNSSVHHWTKVPISKSCHSAAILAMPSGSYLGRRGAELSLNEWTGSHNFSFSRTEKQHE